MHTIEAEFNDCILYKGKPIGPAVFFYNDPHDKDKSFKGIGVFDETG